ncbi:MAG TPA: hypothetical protein VN924_00545 [Bryobacteraceae bacterium]|nr:hypothetical protein [Bryobacteraceae bacterium]
MPKLTPDELQDEREIRDPKMRATLRKGYEEFLACPGFPEHDAFFSRPLHVPL